MSNKSLHNKQVDINSIERINEGILVLKHFLKLNQELLPIYFTLHAKEKKSFSNLETISKIDSVFSTFNFDASTSKILMDSCILDEIHAAYFTIQNNITSIDEKQDALLKFFTELKRLKKNWELVEAN